MAIAVAGPLCRFHADAGHGDPALLQAGVLRWRQDLAVALGPRLPGALSWDEDPAQVVRCCDLGPAGLVAVRLLAVYAQRPELELPEAVPAIPELDRAFREAADQKFARSHFGQLLAADLWLPLEFLFTARAPLPDGQEGEIGSLPVLRDQLRRLNERTFVLDATALAVWPDLPAEAGGDLLPAARRGLGALLAAAEDGCARGLPLALRQG